MEILVIIVFQVLILIMSVVIHEVAHGLSAFWQGDSTAKYYGRLTFNPIKHLDLWGSFIVPLFMIMTFNFGFGWAKPVPYNPYNLRNQKYGPALVGLAGPLSNLILAVVFGLGARFLPMGSLAKIDIIRNFLGGEYENLTYLISGSLVSIFFLLFVMIIVINVFLMFFNLIPIPPLDGSKLLFSILPISEEKKIMLEQFGFVFLFIFIFFFSNQLGFFLMSMLQAFFNSVVGI